MSHAPDCDMTVYGSLPNAQGVICTCDQDDGDDDSPRQDDVVQPHTVANGVMLTGDAARTYKAFVRASAALRKAQADHATALHAFTEAVAK